MELLTMKQVASRLKINPNDAYKLINMGLIPYTILGSKKVLDVDLDKFMRESVGKDLSDINNIKDLEG